MSTQEHAGPFRDCGRAVILIGMTAEQPKGKAYWMDEIAFLEARLNGGQGDIDSDERKACEEALKLAKVNLSARG